MRPLKIISGGQTGVDRAALDAAIELNIPHGGWCPSGRRAEDGKVPSRYVLSETPSSSYWPRTVLNVRDCTATLVVIDSRFPPSPGTSKTLDVLGGTRRVGDTGKDARPHYTFDLNAYDYCMKGVLLWMEQTDTSTLNVAGPRESKCPGIHAATKAFLLEVLQ